MYSTKAQQTIRKRRAIRTRAPLIGTAERPRLSVFRSNQYIYAQLIDDAKGITLAAASSADVKGAKKTKTDIAHAVGELVAKRGIEKGVTKAVFDRGAYFYHGRVKSLADGARKGGLQF